MSNPQRGLGRGLESLFSGISPGNMPEKHGQQESFLVAISQLFANPAQPRQYFSREALEELASSIRQQGVIQPLLVRPRREGGYELVAGERRWRAARLAGLTQVPVLVRDLDDTEVMIVALVENLQREDLSPVEEARAMQTLRERCHLTQEALALRLGKSRSAVTNTLRLLQLPPAVLDDIQQGRLHAGHARALLSLNDPAAQECLRQAIQTHALTVRDAEAAAAQYKETGRFPWGEHRPSSPSPLLSRRRKPALLRTTQKLLRHRLNLRVCVSGSAEQGRITLPYTSAEEFRTLLLRLGVNKEDMAE